MRNRYKPIGNTGGTLLNRQDETNARLHKIKKAVCRVIPMWGASLENPYVTIQNSKIDRLRTIM